MNIAPMARLDDGLLEVIAFQTATRWRLVGRFRTVYAGTHLLEPGVDHFRCREIELRPAGPPAGRRPRAGLFPLDVDGDALGDVPGRRRGRARGAARARARHSGLSIPPVEPPPVSPDWPPPLPEPEPSPT